MKRFVFALLPWAALSACVESTGGALVSFSAEAVGTAEARAFTTPKGYAVTLSRARLYVGALYLNQTNPANHTLETSCVLPGLYTGEVRGGLVVDALEPAPQAFAAAGAGTDAPTRAAELWLTDVDVDAPDSQLKVLDVEGVAVRDGDTWPFDAAFTIGKNRQLAPRDPALPGSNPLCKQRIVSPIATDLSLAEGGVLTLEVDPRAWFAAVEFSELSPSATSPGHFTFIDDSARGGQPDAALFNGVRAVKGPYAFTWRAP